MPVHENSDIDNRFRYNGLLDHNKDVKLVDSISCLRPYRKTQKDILVISNCKSGFALSNLDLSMILTS